MTMGELVYSGELHPFHRRARIVRALRAFSSIRGWERLSALLVPKAAAGPFRVRNQSGLFAGELSSFIDRSMYLRGGYEENHIRANFRVFRREDAACSSTWEPMWERIAWPSLDISRRSTRSSQIQTSGSLSRQT